MAEANVIVAAVALPPAEKERLTVNDAALDRLHIDRAVKAQALADSTRNNTTEVTNTTAAVAQEKEAVAMEARKNANVASQRAALVQQTTRSAAEKKVILEQAVIMALQRKGQVEAAANHKCEGAGGCSS